MDQRTRADRALPPLRPEREVAPETTGEIGDVARRSRSSNASPI